MFVAQLTPIFVSEFGKNGSIFFRVRMSLQRSTVKWWDCTNICLYKWCLSVLLNLRPAFSIIFSDTK